MRFFDFVLEAATGTPYGISGTPLPGALGFIADLTDEHGNEVNAILMKTENFAFKSVIFAPLGYLKVRDAIGDGSELFFVGIPFGATVTVEEYEAITQKVLSFMNQNFNVSVKGNRVAAEALLEDLARKPRYE